MLFTNQAKILKGAYFGAKWWVQSYSWVWRAHEMPNDTIYKADGYKELLRSKILVKWDLNVSACKRQKHRHQWDCPGKDRRDGKDVAHGLLFPPSYLCISQHSFPLNPDTTLESFQVQCFQKAFSTTKI